MRPNLRNCFFKNLHQNHILFQNRPQQGQITLKEEVIILLFISFLCRECSRRFCHSITWEVCVQPLHPSQAQNVCSPLTFNWSFWKLSANKKWNSHLKQTVFPELTKSEQCSVDELTTEVSIMVALAVHTHPHQLHPSHIALKKKRDQDLTQLYLTLAFRTLIAYGTVGNFCSYTLHYISFCSSANCLNWT